MTHSSLALEARDAHLKRFRRQYLVLSTGFTILTVLIVAWSWNQPRDYALGVAFRDSIPILLVASLLANGISFFFQDRYVRRILSSGGQRVFSLGWFVFRFYLYNLLTAVVLSVLLYVPLLLLFFFYAYYPILLWFVPYHAIIGYLVGRELQRNGAYSSTS